MNVHLILFLIPVAMFTSGCDHQRNTAEIRATDSTIFAKQESQQLTESYREVDPAAIEQINIELSSGKLNSDEEVMGAYAPKDNSAEGKYSYQLSKNELPGGLKELILVEEGIMDDAVRSRKVIMVLDPKGSRPRLVSAKETFKCWPGRGHESWSPEPCN